jgi:hypothetical protein
MIALPVRGYHPLRPCFPDRFLLSHIHDWPGPRSLATTSGVSVDVLSSRYLDVSVPWVCLKPPILFGGLILPCDNGSPKPHVALATHRYRASPDVPRDQVCAPSHMVSEFRYRKWVSPFGNPWIKAPSQLPTAYRSVARPSSPLSAKASVEHP